MAIDWSILGSPVDVAGAVNRGFEHGREIRQRGIKDKAFQDLAADPTNPAAFASLASVDPQSAFQMRDYTRKEADYQRGEQTRTALAGAYDPTTGRIDPVRARQAYAGAGDIRGAMEFDASQAKTQGALSDQHREQIVTGARLLQGVTDEPSYQRALGMYKEMGFPLDDIPPNYDPAYVRQVVDAGRALDAKTQTPPNIQREVEYYRSIGKPELADRLLESHAEGPPIITPNGDGTVTVTPRSVLSGSRPAPTAPTSGGNDEASLRAHAEEAIRKGADPAKVNARLQQMLGGAGSQAPRTFP